MIRALQQMAFLAALAGRSDAQSEPDAPAASSRAASSRAASSMAGRRALVYGFGLSGRAAASLLRHLGAEVVILDRRARHELAPSPLDDDPGARMLLGEELEHLPADLAWSDLDAVVVSPGVPYDRPLLARARAEGVPVLAEVELAHRYLRGPIIGITGSNGKSTTTALTAAILEAAGRDAVACGNIGQPLASVVLEDLRADERRATRAAAPGSNPSPAQAAHGEPVATRVVELSSFQLETIDHFHPHAAALLNLSPDHLDRHGSLDAYRAAKLRIFERQGPGDVAVLSADDPALRNAAAGLRARCRFFSLRGPVADGCYLHQGTVFEVDASPDRTEPAAPVRLFDAGDLPLPGPHNLENAMAAALLVRAFGIEPEAIRRGLRHFGGLPHRLEKVRERQGVVWFDDSKGTNPAATVRSLEGFEDGRVLLILGGVFKGGDLEELGRMVARKAVVAYLIGESAARFERELRAVPGMTAAIERVDTLDRAVERAARAARTGDVVLLSPACASFDQFTNFAERGRLFRQRVDALPESGEGDHGA